VLPDDLDELGQGVRGPALDLLDGQAAERMGNDDERL